MMEIKIKISKKTAEHFLYPHTFYYSCSETQQIMKKVLKEIKKKSGDKG